MYLPRGPKYIHKLLYPTKLRPTRHFVSCERFALTLRTGHNFSSRFTYGSGGCCTLLLAQNVTAMSRS